MRLVDRPGAVQSNLRIGGLALPRTDPDHPAQELANAVFAGPFSSRLVQNIREDKGYTYSPRSTLHHNGRASFALLQADVATEVTAPALVEMGYELGRIVSLPPTAEEVGAMAQHLVGVLALSTSTQAGMAARCPCCSRRAWTCLAARAPAAAAGGDAGAGSRGRAADAGAGDPAVTVVGDASAVGGPLRALGAVELV